MQNRAGGRECQDFELYREWAFMVGFYAMIRQAVCTLGVLVIWGTGACCGEVKFPGEAPGKARVECDGAAATLSNDMFSARFRKAGNGVVFDGLALADGTSVAAGGTHLFVIHLANGTSYDSKTLNSGNLTEEKLEVDKQHPQLAQRLPGKAVSCTFTTPDKQLEINWKAVLRNGSHYLRQELEVKARKDTAFASLTPLEYRIEAGGTPVLSGNTTHGKVVVNKLIFGGLETPMSKMSAPGGSADSNENERVWNAKRWYADLLAPVFQVPASFATAYGNTYAEKDGPVVVGLKMTEGPVNIEEAGTCKMKFGGGLNVVAVQLLARDSDKIVAEDVHQLAPRRTIYKLEVPEAGAYTLRVWVDTRTGEPAETEGRMAYSVPVTSGDAPRRSSGEAALVRGEWERRTTLRKGQSWKVSSVLGFFAPGQQRRSFLAYSERERAVSYRLFIHYNDWYEIGIRINNNDDPLKRNSEAWQLAMLETWKRELFQKRKTRIDGFVIDDGWDDFNSLWDFHAGFPNGFSKIDRQLRSMKTGLGTWLGPVGGYGKAKSLRLGHWNKKHPNNQIGNFQLSNKEYFDAFVGRCSQMVRDYDMRYFKFDGISTHFHSKGPGNLEDAEGIIRVLEALRRARRDIFLNTTVGTWASPFWFHYSDCVWRQENDFGQEGSAGDARDKWITYRDRLVHEVFITGAPLFPINSVMTHGLIITKNGPPHVMSKEPANCIKEMRAAFGCGSALMELYVDQDLMNQENGRLWDELARCIKWLRRNEDVLADVHWVGGNPWDRNTGDGSIYGWAAWSPAKCTLTLRNSSASAKTLRTTLREILDVPPSVRKDKVTFRSSFDDQRPLPPLVDNAVDIDKTIEITLEPMEVIVLEGICAAGRKKDTEPGADDDAEKPDKKKKKRRSKKKRA